MVNSASCCTLSSCRSAWGMISFSHVTPGSSLQSTPSVKVFRVPIRRYANTVCVCVLCSWFLASSLEVTLLSLQYFALVTENTNITTITIGFNSFYHQISRDGEAGKYLLLHRK